MWETILHPILVIAVFSPFFSFFSPFLILIYYFLLLSLIIELKDTTTRYKEAKAKKINIQ